MFGWGVQELTDDEKANLVVTLRERLLDGTPDVEQQLLNGGEAGLPPLDDRTLTRWLYAEEYNIDTAEERLRQHAKWRESEFPDGRVLQEEIATELKTKKGMQQGLDFKGRQVIVLRANRYYRATRNLPKEVRGICYGLDKAIAMADRERNPVGYISVIIDLRGVGLENIDLFFLKRGITLLQEHYPERLAKMYMFEAPVVFSYLWKALLPFVKPNSKEKVRFLFGKAGLDELASDMDIKMLAKDMGGEGEDILCQDIPEPPSLMWDAKSGFATHTRKVDVTNGV